MAKRKAGQPLKSMRDIHEQTEGTNVYYSNDEIKEIQNYLGHVPGSTFDFTPEPIQKALTKDKWPVFKLRPLGPSDQAALLDYYSKNKLFDGMDLKVSDEKKLKEQITKKILTSQANEVFSKNYELSRYLVQRCLVGWTNFRDIDGVELEFKSENGKVSDATLDCIPMPLMNAIFMAVQSTNKLNEKEKRSLE